MLDPSEKGLSTSQGGNMENALQSAIDAAAKCGIIVEITLAETEEEFHKAAARFANEPNGRQCTSFECDPLKAIQSAIDTLVHRGPETTLQ